MTTNFDMQSCIDECSTCHRVCAETLQHCLHTGGPHAEADHVRLMLDCVQICHTSADFMIRNSPLHVHTCAACAEVCQLCADDCERLARDDAAMRRCAESCRAMAGGHVHA